MITSAIWLRRPCSRVRSLSLPSWRELIQKKVRLRRCPQCPKWSPKKWHLVITWSRKRTKICSKTHSWQTTRRALLVRRIQILMRAQTRSAWDWMKMLLKPRHPRDHWPTFVRLRKMHYRGRIRLCSSAKEGRRAWQNFTSPKAISRGRKNCSCLVIAIRMPGLSLLRASMKLNRALT